MESMSASTQSRRNFSDEGRYALGMRGLVLWGIGGHGKVVADVALAMGCFSIIAFVDDDASKTQGAFHSYRIEGMPDVLGLLKEKGYIMFHVSIGSNEARARCFVRALKSGLAPRSEERR